MDITLRKGIKGDLPQVLALIKELAEYENALDQVEVTLNQLEKDRVKVNTKDSSKKTSPNVQMNLFQINDPKTTKIINLLNNIDVNTLTPVESLMKLNEIKQLLEN